MARRVRARKIEDYQMKRRGTAQDHAVCRGSSSRQKLENNALGEGSGVMDRKKARARPSLIDRDGPDHAIKKANKPAGELHNGGSIPRSIDKGRMWRMMVSVVIRLGGEGGLGNSGALAVSYRTSWQATCNFPSKAPGELPSARTREFNEPGQWDFASELPRHRSTAPGSTAMHRQAQMPAD